MEGRKKKMRGEREDGRRTHIYLHTHTFRGDGETHIYINIQR